MRLFFILGMVGGSLILAGCWDKQTAQNWVETAVTNPQAAVGEILEKTKLKDMSPEMLQQKYKDLTQEITTLQVSLETKKDQGLAKIEEVQLRLSEAQRAFEETKQAIENLNQAGQNFKESVGL